MSALRVTRVRMHQAGVRKMLGSPPMVFEMRRRMNRVRIVAIMISPIDTGNYISRFTRPTALESGLNAHGVAFARLSNDAREPQAPGGFCYALALEVGTKHMRAQRVLQRALKAAAD